MTVTDSTGHFQFGDVQPGTYQLEFTAPAGFGFTLEHQGDPATDSDVDGNGNRSVFTVSASQGTLELDAGLINNGAITAAVFEDSNSNGIRDPGEPGVVGVTVNLFNDGGQFGTTTTDSNGNYSFTGLAPGGYDVQYILPSGQAFTIQNASGNPSQDSSPDPYSGFAPVSVGYGYSTMVNAGLVPAASVSGSAWQDNNDDGIWQSSEAGLAGVEVSLYTGAGSFVEAMTTDASGHYEFDGLTPGPYDVVFSAPPGSTFSPEGQGSAVDATGTSSTFTLTSGSANTGLNAGLYSRYSIGSFVWADVNGNGIRDSGEPGIPNVTVQLLDANQNVLATTTSDANGHYQFAGLAAGNYYVKFVLPAGEQFTVQNGADDPSQGSSADPNTGLAFVSLFENDMGVDAGMYQPATVSGSAWQDANQDGVWQQGEFGLAGIGVNLYSTVAGPVATTTTDSQGHYQFSGVAPGPYYVVFAAPPGFVFSPEGQGSDADATGTTATFSLTQGQSLTQLNAGLNAPGAGGAAVIGQYVWEDLNGNGLQDAGESGIPNVTVQLLANNNVIATTTTNATGYYDFLGVAPGTYTVRWVLPAGYAFTLANVGSNPALNSSANPASGSASVTVTGTKDILTLDAGMYRPVIIRGTAWQDSNHDGIRQQGEAGLPNILVELVNQNNQIVATTTTDANGNYVFQNIAPGTYSVVFVPTGNWTFSPPYQGGDSTDWSDVDPTGHTAYFTMYSGEEMDYLNAGLYPSS
jgi:protocatechuate 3,4-dioxygenase beta subunit